MRISDWSSDVCSSDLLEIDEVERGQGARRFIVWGHRGCRAEWIKRHRGEHGAGKQTNHGSSTGPPRRAVAEFQMPMVNASDDIGLREPDRKSTRLNSSH